MNFHLAVINLFTEVSNQIEIILPNSMLTSCLFYTGVALGAGFDSRVRLHPRIQRELETRYQILSIWGETLVPLVSFVQVVESCSTDPCPTLTPWSDWTTCSKSCGSGRQRRVRQCKVHGYGRNPCQQPLEEDRACNGQVCPLWTGIQAILQYTFLTDFR